VLVIVCLLKWLGAKPANPPEIRPELAPAKAKVGSEPGLVEAKAVQRVQGEQIYQFQNHHSADENSSLPERLPGLP
jgi:hypothetical protein